MEHGQSAAFSGELGDAGTGSALKETAFCVLSLLAVLLIPAAIGAAVLWTINMLVTLIVPIMPFHIGG